MNDDYEVNRKARELVKDLLKDIFEYGKTHTAEDQQDLHVTIIAGLVASFATTTLSKSLDKLEPKKRGEVAMAAFSQMKEKLTTAVAMGFGAAVTSGTGKELDYYCVLQATPEAKNKMPA
jgi:hypothetical protein